MKESKALAQAVEHQRATAAVSQPLPLAQLAAKELVTWYQSFSNSEITAGLRYTSPPLQSSLCWLTFEAGDRPPLDLASLLGDGKDSELGLLRLHVDVENVQAAPEQKRPLHGLWLNWDATTCPAEALKSSMAFWVRQSLAIVVVHNHPTMTEAEIRAALGLSKNGSAGSCGPGLMGTALFQTRLCC